MPTFDTIGVQYAQLENKTAEHALTMMHSRTSLVAVTLLSAALLSACQTASVQPESQPAAAPKAAPATTAPVASSAALSSCDYRGAPMLKNPELKFDYQRGRPAGWLINQHGGDKTYEVDSRDGILRINNYGKQYWMRLSQRFPAHDLVGREFVFSADIKMDLNPEGWVRTLVPGGGLTVVVRGQKPGTHNTKSVLYTTSMPNEPRHGQLDWHRREHRFTIPEGARFLELGFLHQAHGEMWIQDPQFIPTECIKSI